MLASCAISFSNIQGQTTVRITNSLDGNLDLTLHCKSKEDDLGVKLIHQGAFFEWSFNTFFIEPYGFYCNFRWKNVSTWFVIYDVGRDARRCKLCYWIIKQDGPCLVGPPNAGYEPICYKWYK